MLFNSLTFAVFFAAVLLLHSLPLPWRAKKGNLLVASYLFYAAWNPPFVVLLWISTGVDWFAAGRMAATSSLRARRGFLALSLLVNLGLLGYFKYAAFALENFVLFVRQFGFDYSPAPPDIVLPLGISFYTFQTLSYSISVYRGESRPASSFLDFALFVTFFPQLVAGPIVRSREFLGQLAAPVRANRRQFGWGLALLTFGLFEKVILADAFLAPVVERVYANAAAAGSADAWIATVAFAGQVFFDFGGYSACAIGAALCLGFVLPQNFNCPYAAVGFADFWRRWHITLSTWLRDYVFYSLISLREGRSGNAIRAGALFATMVLGGLWHGASWTFIVWGAVHGFMLIAEHGLRAAFGGVAFFHSRGFIVFAGGLTIVLTVLSLVFFRAESLNDALHLLALMFAQAPGQLVGALERIEVFVVAGAMLATQIALRNRDLETVFMRFPIWLRVPVLAIPILSLLLVPGDQRAFIYFQF
ncbi:MAG: MBOAT family O-acyltransferase [Myxococcota bacterium]|jgi:D-alanyl-lipoteichoic acid acyltransferase DltB (MBOAT superfamily)|nr:MBOAT family O-acyltransferase [Myxococcota bacterium]